MTLQRLLPALDLTAAGVVTTTAGLPAAPAAISGRSTSSYMTVYLFP